MQPFFSDVEADCHLCRSPTAKFSVKGTQAVPHLARGRKSRQLCGRICKRLGIPVPPLPRKGGRP